MPGSNPLDDTGSIKNHASEMRKAGLTLGNHMLYTTFNGTLLAEHEAEARNLAICESFGREEIITTARERHHRLSGNRYKGANAGHAMYATDGASGGRGRGESHGRGRGGRWGRKDEVRGTNEDGGGSITADGGDRSNAKADEGSILAIRCYRCGKKRQKITDCTKKLCTRCNGRGHTAGVCSTAKEEVMLTVTSKVGARVDDSKYIITQASAFRAEETGEYDDAVSRKGGEAFARG